MDSEGSGATSGVRRIGLAAGAILCAVMLVTPPPENLDPAAWRTAAVAVLMACWWISEAIPIPATALLPLVLFPLLGVAGIKGAAAPYAHPLIFLFLGGFLIALGMQRWNLHRRIALNLIRLTGTRPAGLIAGFMIATAALSMWVSNTATTMMMVPIALSVVQLVAGSAETIRERDRRTFAVALMLGIAYAASIGGVGTLIGTPPNAFRAAFLEEGDGVEVGFARWLRIGVPLVAVMLPIAWLVLTRIVAPIDLGAEAHPDNVIATEIEAMGPMSRGERTVLVVFVLTATLWILRPLISAQVPGIGLNDSTIAILGGLLLFVLPVDLAKGEFALTWHWAEKLPWGVLILFGGGLTLASAIKATGLAAWIGAGTGSLAAMPALIIVLAITALVIFLTELTSNTATTATFVPIVASVAIGLGENPLMLVVPAVLAASYAFMMPVATPPNAIVFGSGHVTIAEMVRAGLWLNIVGVAVIAGFSYTLVALVLGVEPGVVPEWAAPPG